MKPFVDKWNQLKGKEKTETRTNITSCDEALQRDGIGQLSAEHRKRGEIIKSLENFQKKLNQGHRIGTHTDSPEMQDLKKKLNTALTALKKNDKGIYDDRTMSNMLKDISQSARAYTDAKKEDAGVSKDSTTYLPKTKMGKTRYQAALDLEKEMRKLSKEVGGRVASYEIGKRMKEKGFKVVAEDDIHLEHGAGTYNAKTAIGMNYFGKEPVCIPEHCKEGGNRVFTEEQFERQYKPYKLDGVSNEEFAFTAYAAIFNPSVISKKLEKAGKTNRPLSAEEKKSCMQDIMRAEFADTVRTKAWNEMLEKDEKFMEYAKNEARFIMDIAMNKTTLTSEDYAYKKGRLQRDAIKPVFKVAKALRTPEGMQTFENTVGQLTGKMDVGKSEKELLADVNLMRDQLKNGKKAEQKAPVRTAPKKKVTATRQMSD